MAVKSTIYEFSGFRLETANKVLQRDGKVIPITPKVYDTLLVLVENADRLLEKDELMQTIWRDSFVEESNLTFNVKMLRKALSDDASNPTFIETVPRRGYRFIAKVKEISDEDETVSEVIRQESTENILPNTPQKPTGKHLLAIGAGIFIFAVFGLAFYLKNPLIGSTQSFRQINRTELTTSGKSYYSIISPDGKYIIHAQNEGGKQSLLIRQTAESRDIEIVEPTAGQFGGLAVSPDSKSVFYTLWKENQPDAILYQVPILGGTSKQIISNIDSGVSFSADGKEFVFFRTNKSQGLSQLIIANADGTNQRTIAEKISPETFETEFGDPIWKPDERKILAIATSNVSGSKSSIIEIEIETGVIKTFADVQWRDIQQIAWLKKSNNLLLTAFDEDSNSNQIWHIDSKTGNYRKVTDDLRNYRGISLTDDEKTLITTQSEQISRLWESNGDFTANATEILSESGNTDENSGLAWTEENELIFSVGEGEYDNISIKDASGIRPLTFDGKGNRQPTVCGKSIVFTANFVSNDPNQLRLMKMDSDGKNLGQLNPDATENEMYPNCSTKSDWIVYQRGLEKATIWKMPIDGGNSVQLTETNSFQPNISPDGKLVAYFNLVNYKWSINIISIKDSKLLKEIPVSSKSKLRCLRWTSDGNLAYSDTLNGVSNIFMQPIDGRQPMPLTAFESDLIYNFNWSADSKKSAFYRVSSKSNVVAITDNSVR